MIKKCFIIGLILFGFCFPQNALAAEIGLDASQPIFHVSETFSVNLWLDTQGESVNAVEGAITFDPAKLEFKEASDGNSLINFWIEKSDTRFSGIIPGGYTGKGMLLKFFFQPLQEGNATLTAESIRVLRNDGQGTEVETKMLPLEMNIVPAGSGADSGIVLPQDQDLPEPFDPEISKNPKAFDGNYFLVFGTQDKGSGINHYEVQEGNRPYETAKSPYLLKNQGMSEPIRVKAVDQAGNERVESLKSDSSKSKNIFFWLFLIFLLIFFIFKKRSGKYHLLLFVFGVALLSSAFPAQAQAARLYLWPSSGSFNAGKEFQTTLFVNSEDQAMNAISGSLTFPQDVLEIVSIAKTNSIVSLWVKEPSFSNATSSIHFEGIVLNPGFSGKGGKILTLNLRAKKPGSAALIWNAGAILANDGQGTNITNGLSNAHFELTSPPLPPPAPPAPKIELSPALPVPAPVITPKTEPAIPPQECLPCGGAAQEPKPLPQPEEKWVIPMAIVIGILLLINSFSLFMLGYLWHAIRQKKHKLKKH